MPAPKRPNTAAATAAVIRKAQDRKAAELKAAGWTVEPPGRDSANWDTAIDWLLNSRHTADPDIQTAFWAIADGIATEDEVEELLPSEIRERRKAAAQEDPILPDHD